MPTTPPRRRRGTPLPVVVVALAVTMATVAATTVLLIRPAVSTQRWALDRDVATVSTANHDASPWGLHLFLVPHPDDELSGWTSLAEARGLRPVLVLLTQGEATVRCSEKGLAKYLQANLGEVPPNPDPVSPVAGPEVCREARLNAFRAWLAEAARHTPVVDVDWAAAVPLEQAGPHGQIVHGPGASVAVLDLGDGALTAQGVEEAVRALLEDPRAGLPELPVGRVTASSYFSTDAAWSASACDVVSTCPADEEPYVYDHDDHLAVQDAARALAPLSDQGSWLVTHPYDPAVTTHLALPEEVYEQFMGLGPGRRDQAMRTGTHQRLYGWLAFPDVWRPGDLPLQSDEVLFPRIQSYEVVVP